MILVTGASGFVGSSLVEHLIKDKMGNIKIATRRQLTSLPKGVEQIRIDNVDGNVDWGTALRGVDTVIHLAARAHIMKDQSLDPLTEFRKVNVDGTLNLAAKAVDENVRRFIYLSSIKVNGDTTPPDAPYKETDCPQPVDAYGISKHEAEEGLKRIIFQSCMELVIIRPPLVYGPNVKANFKNMVKWLYKGIPLPLGTIYNKRSMVALDNLVDLIKCCIIHPAAANQTFMVSDDDDLSTTELLQRMAFALGKPALLIPVPARILTVGAALIGKHAIAQRLCESLQVDISHLKRTLSWTPIIDVDEALQSTANYYIEQLKNR